MKRISLVLVLFCLNLYAQDVAPAGEPLSAEETVPAVPAASGWQGEQAFYFGLSARTVTIRVRKAGSLSASGVMMNELGYFPLIGYDTKTYYFSGTRWGWFFSSNSGTFSITTQRVTTSSGYKIEDLGTRVDGVFAYGTPVFFYDWGDKAVFTSEQHRFRIGGGFGLSYLTMDGDIILSDSGVDQNHSISTSGVTLSFGMLMEYRIGPWMFRFIGNWPFFREDDYRYSFGDVSLNIGYALAF